jgi:hypothetical protein
VNYTVALFFQIANGFYRMAALLRDAQRKAA